MNERKSIMICLSNYKQCRQERKRIEHSTSSIKVALTEVKQEKERSSGPLVMCCYISQYGDHRGKSNFPCAPNFALFNYRHSLSKIHCHLEIQ